VNSKPRDRKLELKRQLKQFFKKSFYFNLASSLTACILISTSSASARNQNFCYFLSSNQILKTTKRYNQNPVELLEHLIQASNQEKNTQQQQNKLLAASFDIQKIYQTNARVFKSRTITNSLFDWVRLQFFGNLKSNYKSRSEHLLKKNYDLLTPRERKNMQNLTPRWTGVKKMRCSRTEKNLLGCNGTLLQVSAQFLPEVSCKSKSLKTAFTAHFYLTHHHKYGFRILDIKLAGKRLVLDSLNMMASLKKEGFNKSAIIKHLDVLTQGKKSFKVPKRQVHSGNYLARYRAKIDKDRIPASL